MSDILDRLALVIGERRNADPDSSYVAGLLAADIDRVLKKVGEEATEVVIAAKGGNESDIVHETADLLFHLLVMLEHQNIRPDVVMQELERRFGTSGIEEKAARSANTE